MTLTEQLDKIVQNLGISDLPNRLLTTYWEAIAKDQGVDVDSLPDRLVSTYICAILKAKGTEAPDRLTTTQCEALACALGASDIPDRLISTLLDIIGENIVDGVKHTIVITGEEAFNFQSANNTVYYKNSDFVNVPHDNIVRATCTHFTWGNGAVISDMKDGQFIFNYTKSSGIGTGNISFKNNTLFLSTSDAKDFFKEELAKGTPVTITVWVKE